MEQLGEGGLIDGPHDAAAHAFIPSGQRQVGQRDAEVNPVVTGQRGVIHHGGIQRRLFTGLRGALLRRQIGRPFDQRLHGSHGFGGVHDDQPHRLAVGSAGGNTDGFDEVLHHILRHSFLPEPAVGAAGEKLFHHRHLINFSLS